jgi:hypothetical protein
MKANVESDIYTCEVCKQVFKDSSFPAQCPRCQSSRISNADLERLTLPQLGLTLRQLRQIISRNPALKFRRFRHLSSELIKQIIPTVEEIKQEEIKRKELLKQREIKCKELQ